jgi:hypothetical protein
MSGCRRGARCENNERKVRPGWLAGDPLFQWKSSTLIKRLFGNHPDRGAFPQFFTQVLEICANQTVKIIADELFCGGACISPNRREN